MQRFNERPPSNGWKNWTTVVFIVCIFIALFLYAVAYNMNYYGD